MHYIISFTISYFDFFYNIKFKYHSSFKLYIDIYRGKMKKDLNGW